MPFFFSKVHFFLLVPFLHCPSGGYAVVVIQVECGCLNNNAHSTYQFILNVSLRGIQIKDESFPFHLIGKLILKEVKGIMLPSKSSLDPS